MGFSRRRNRSTTSEAGAGQNNNHYGYLGAGGGAGNGGRAVVADTATHQSFLTHSLSYFTRTGRPSILSLGGNPNQVTVDGRKQSESRAGPVGLVGGEEREQLARIESVSLEDEAKVGGTGGTTVEGSPTPNTRFLDLKVSCPTSDKSRQESAL